MEETQIHLADPLSNDCLNCGSPLGTNKECAHCMRARAEKAEVELGDAVKLLDAARAEVADARISALFAKDRLEKLLAAAKAKLAAARDGKLYEVIDTGEHTIAHPGFYVLPMQIRLGRYLTQKATLKAAHEYAAERGLVRMEDAMSYPPDHPIARKALDEKGRCCGRKPFVYKSRWSTAEGPCRFCGRCCRSYDINTGQQIQNWAWRQKEDGSFVRKGNLTP